MTFRNEILCGEQKVNLSPSPTECTGKHCERSFYIYVPTSLCDENESIEDDILPTVFALHCYGCTYDIFQFWEPIAEFYRFVLVIPEGIQRSWNAVHCCGWAVHENVDDEGFLRHIVTTLDERYSFVSPALIYGIGWSNGGFMVSRAAEMFRAVAPISGHMYDLSYLQRPTPAFFHHGADDEMVRPTGCCTDPSMPSCCCDISSFSPDTCTTVYHVFLKWAVEVNGCGSSQTVETFDKDRNIRCYEASGEDCQAPTKFCLHYDQGHFAPLIEYAFPPSMMNEIADFFAEDACTAHDGMWSSESKICSCPNYRQGDPHPGTYCTTSTLATRALSFGLDVESTSSSLDPRQFLWISLIGFSFIFIVALTRRISNLTNPRK